MIYRSQNVPGSITVIEIRARAAGPLARWRGGAAAVDYGAFDDSLLANAAAGTVDGVDHDHCCCDHRW